MSEIFVSYARSTASQAKVVAAALRASGYDVWIDDDLPAHRAHRHVIKEQVRAAKAVVVIWSADAAESDWVPSEATVAREARKLVQLTIDNAPLPMPFDQIHCVDMHGWNGDTAAPGWRKIVASIAELLGTAVPRTNLTPTPVPIVESTEPLLAVLAFDNLSGDTDMAYFSDGVSEEIQQTLARGSELKVIGRASSFQFRGAAKAARNVATELKATHVLDGSVRRSGNKVRIAAQLIDCASQTTVWSDRFDRDLSDIFAMQDEIATAVAAALKTTFAPAVEGAVNPAAFELFLRAHELSYRPSRSGDCIEMLERVVTLAPRFARAWAYLAHARALLLSFSGTSPACAALRVGVVEAAETALRLDPHVGSAYAALSTLKPFGAHREREVLIERALSMSPRDPQSLTSMGTFYNDVGRQREALSCVRSAYQLDPFFFPAATWYVTTLGLVGDYAEYARLCDVFRNRWPDLKAFIMSPAVVAAHYGDWARFDAISKFAEKAGFMTDRVVRGFFRLGKAIRDHDVEFATRMRKLLNDQLADTGTVQLQNLVSATRLGLREEVFSAIEKASFEYVFEEGGPLPAGGLAPGTIFDTGLSRKLMDDIRFVGLCAKLGLCDYWVQTDRWPDCADAVAPYYDFKAEARRLVADRLSTVSSTSAPERLS